LLSERTIPPLPKRRPVAILVHKDIWVNGQEDLRLFETLQMLVERSNVPGWLGCNFRSNGLYWGKVVPLLSGFSAHDSSGIKVKYLYGGQVTRGSGIAGDNTWHSIRVDA
jgi:hypothetical protein